MLAFLFKKISVRYFCARCSLEIILLIYDLASAGAVSATLTCTLMLEFVDGQATLTVNATSYTSSYSDSAYYGSPWRS